jgi:hypothetical protein
MTVLLQFLNHDAYTSDRVGLHRSVFSFPFDKSSNGLL